MTEQISIGVLVICAMSYGISPIGHPVAIIAMELFSSLQVVNYAQFLMVGLLSAGVFFVLFLLVMRFVFRLDVEKFRSFDPDLLKKDIGPVTKEEIVSLGVFLIVVAWWVLPGLIRDILPGVYTFMDNLGYCFPLLLAIAFFCTVPVNGKLMMHHVTSLKRDASWQAAYPYGYSHDALCRHYPAGSRYHRICIWTFAPCLRLYASLCFCAGGFRSSYDAGEFLQYYNHRYLVRHGGGYIDAEQHHHRCGGGTVLYRVCYFRLYGGGYGQFHLWRHYLFRRLGYKAKTADRGFDLRGFGMAGDHSGWLSLWYAVVHVMC